MTKEDERSCLRGLANGNKQAFEWLFLTWHPRVVDFFMRVLADEDTAYDYAQDIFYDIWVQRKKFSEVESFSAYLFRMAKFRLFNHFDKQSVRNKFVDAKSFADASSFVSMEQSLFADEMEEQIWKTVNKMPAKRRKIFVMSRMQGYSNDEIAKELGISKRTVENHITSALAELREIVAVIIFLCVICLNFYLI
ncbi:MAG: RNA polymerase sigma-70 factor [Bacteroidales bacterium]|nr:RNA polymerase sigma-70 factor [Bacteroidales bacterium]